MHRVEAAVLALQARHSVSLCCGLTAGVLWVKNISGVGQVVHRVEAAVFAIPPLLALPPPRVTLP